MRGPVGSELTVTIQRGEEDPFDVTITRDVITIESVRWLVEDDVGYIRVTSFTEQTQGRRGGGDRGDPGASWGDDVIATCSISATIPAACSTRRSRSPTPFWSRARLSRPAAATRRIAALQPRGGRPDRRSAAGRADQRRLRLGVGDRRRPRASGITAGRSFWAPKSFGKGSVQGPSCRCRAMGAMRLDHGALLHAGRTHRSRAEGIDPDIIVQPARIEEIEGPRPARGPICGGALSNGDGDGSAVPAEDDGAADDGAAEDGAGDEGAAVEAGSEALPEDPRRRGGGNQPVDYQLTRALDLLRGWRCSSSGRCGDRRRPAG